VLKPGGLFALVEMEGTTNAYKDKEKRGVLAAYTYSVGLYVRKPEEDPNAGKFEQTFA
jgi:hypothetical protein